MAGGLTLKIQGAASLEALAAEAERVKESDRGPIEVSSKSRQNHGRHDEAEEKLR